MRLDVLCTDGSPLGVSTRTIYGDDFQVGVGGAENFLLTMCETWHDLGHEVVLYNNPRELGASSFEQRQISQFNPNDKRDILITFRSANAKAVAAKGMKVWLSCDQFTTGNFKQFSAFMDKIVVISPFHKQYFEDNYGITNAIVTDIPVRQNDYETFKKVEKIKHRFLFSSIPDRGLNSLWRMWPLIKQEIPDASLVITSDYRLWGVSSAGNEQHRAKWVAREDFNFLGAVPRMKLVEEQMKSQALIYPCTYNELFCIAVSEAQYAGCYPITTSCGALPTTNMGTVVKWDATDPRGDRLFVDVIKSTLEDVNFEKRVKDLKFSAWKRFNPYTIASFWEESIFNG
jgi:glycosyltransferase involved in cell wall biosynthesis